MKKSLVKKVMATTLVSAMMFSALPMNTSAANNDAMVVVSLGDSYSSGEGIPAFYGQDKPWEQKVYDEDWLAHRSTKSWPGLLEIPDIGGKLRDYNVKETNSTKCKWYFGAVSGAVTKNISKERQKKSTYKWISLFKTMKTTSYLPKQIDFINNASEAVDYVTITIGGNDMGFADVITTCATGSTYLHFGNDKLKLEKQIDEIWSQFNTTRANIKEVYSDLQSAAGTQANIIVAGYPKLLDKEGKGALISEKEATIVNQNVTKFNNKIKEIVTECQNQGMNVHFVDVEAEFDKDGGHQAYSDDAWINKIILAKQDQDLEQNGIGSSYSIHPNEEGAKAYARCVNAKIKEIENNKKSNRSAMLLNAPETAVTEAVEAVTDETLTTAAVTDAVSDTVETAAADEAEFTEEAAATADFTITAALSDITE